VTDSSTDTEADVTPIACTLTADDLAKLRDRWHELASTAFVAREKTHDGLRLVFRPDPGVAEQLERLIAVERECCAWADWRLESADSGVVVDVCSRGDGVAALHTMFTTLGA
jgi:hypothetical protein